MRKLIESIESKNLLSLSDILINLVVLNKEIEQILNKNNVFCLKALDYAIKSKKTIPVDILAWSYFQILSDKISYKFLYSVFDFKVNSENLLTQKIIQKYIDNIEEISISKKFWFFFQDKQVLNIDYFEKIIAYPLKTNFISLINENNKLLIIEELKKLDSFYIKKEIKVISKIIDLIELIEKSNTKKISISKNLPKEVTDIILDIEKTYSFLKETNFNQMDRIKIDNLFNEEIRKIISSFEEYELIKNQTNQDTKHFSGKSALEFTTSSLIEINKYFKSLLLNQQEEIVKDLSIQNRYTKMKNN